MKISRLYDETIDNIYRQKHYEVFSILSNGSFDKCFHTEINT